MSTRSDAAFLHIALSIGLRTLDDAIAWADATIKGASTPPLPIIELALVRTADDAIASLGALVDSEQCSAAMRPVLEELLDLLASDRAVADRAIESLYHYTFQHHPGSRLHDEVSLLTGKYGQSVESQIADLIRRLDNGA